MSFALTDLSGIDASDFLIKLGAAAPRLRRLDLGSTRENQFRLLIRRAGRALPFVRHVDLAETEIVCTKGKVNLDDLPATTKIKSVNFRGANGVNRIVGAEPPGLEIRW